jgi:hypothetical protein
MDLSGQMHAPATGVTPGKDSPVPIEQEAGRAPEYARTFRKREKCLASAR